MSGEAVDAEKELLKSQIAAADKELQVYKQLELQHTRRIQELQEEIRRLDLLEELRRDALDVAQ
jgi:cell division protein FtsB